MFLRVANRWILHIFRSHLKDSHNITIRCIYKCWIVMKPGQEEREEAYRRRKEEHITSCHTRKNSPHKYWLRQDDIDALSAYRQHGDDTARWYRLFTICLRREVAGWTLEQIQLRWHPCACEPFLYTDCLAKTTSATHADSN
jgi:hypothetical protein